MPTAPSVASTFNGIPLDWESGGLSRAKIDGVQRLSGNVIVYNQADVTSLEALFRPIHVDAPADGTERAYIRYFGTDPAKTLITPGARDLVAAGGWTVQKTASAILYEFVAQPIGGGVWKCQMAFALTTTETDYTPPPEDP